MHSIQYFSCKWNITFFLKLYRPYCNIQNIIFHFSLLTVYKIYRPIALSRRQFYQCTTNYIILYIFYVFLTFNASATMY